MTARRRPFSNGAQAGDWRLRNCHRCARFAPEPTCEIELATGLAYFTDGTVHADIAKRMGLEAAGPLAMTWDCPERETPGAPQRHGGER